MDQHISVTDVVRRVTYVLKQELQDLTLSLANEHDQGRRSLLKQYVNNSRHKLMKLYVLIKWATSEHPSIVRRCNRELDFFMRNEFRLEDAVNQLRKASVVLYVARAPKYDVDSALDILSSGSYLRLPKCIPRVSGDDSLDARVPIMDKQETLRKLEQLILERLLKTEIPPFYTNFSVREGILVCTVDHEFEVSLGLSQAGMDAPWTVLRLEIFVQAEDTTISSDSKKRRRGVVGTLDGTQDDEDDESLASEKHRPRKSAKTLGEAFRPKPGAVFYLLRMVQEKLLNSTNPLVDMYNILHGFCASLCIRVLEAQAHELKSHEWKDRHLKVKMNSSNALELKYWGDACVLRLSHDKSCTRGNLQLETEPRIDTTHGQTLLASSLFKPPPTFKKRNLLLQDQPDQGVFSVDTSAYVDGLCPSSLNIEKILLLSALSHAENLLTKVGQRLDALLFSGKVGTNQSGWICFDHPVAIVSSEHTVSLQVDLPVERYLCVTVEMRSGHLMLHYLKRGSVAENSDTSRRRWGSDFDRAVLLRYEKKLVALDQIHNKLDDAAKLLDQVVRILSVQSILESYELAAETLGLRYQRSCPSPILPKANRPALDDTWSLFIHLETWAGLEVYQLVATADTVNKLWPDVANRNEKRMVTALVAIQKDEFPMILGTATSLLDDYSCDDAIRASLQRIRGLAEPEVQSAKLQHYFKSRVGQAFQSTLQIAQQTTTVTVNREQHILAMACGSANVEFKLCEDTNTNMEVIIKPQRHDLWQPLTRPVLLFCPYYVHPLTYDASMAVCSFVVPENELVLSSSKTADAPQTEITRIQGIENRIVGFARMQLLIHGFLCNMNQHRNIEIGSAVTQVLAISHSLIMLESKHDSIVLRATIGIVSPSRFSVKILSIQGTTAFLPWVDEIDNLLNSCIPSTVTNTFDWNSVVTVARQVVASLALGLPLLPLLRTVCTANVDKPYALPDPSTQGRKPGQRGKVGFSASPSDVPRKSRMVSIVPLSHLRLRLCVGEEDHLDILIQNNGCKVSGDPSRLRNMKPEEQMPYSQVPEYVKKCMEVLLV